jgi:hypothetical protein
VVLQSVAWSGYRMAKACFYEGENILHPITIIEIIIAGILVLITLLISLMVPKKAKKTVLIIALYLFVLEIGFFILRPYWIDYQVTKKVEQLNKYLQMKYPNESWVINHKDKSQRQYSPYALDVTFTNEPKWIYTYSVRGEDDIKQVGWTCPEGKVPRNGKHYEPSPD